MSESDQWFIVKQDNGQCAIVPNGIADPSEDVLAGAESGAGGKQWGPFASQAEAIARRVGLIRAGKCQPA
ncbi:hypothetical protein JOY44_05790 [Phormidium sp. CLA17]|uniref:hypothetical protein n=1 Tax=Leptolyngbya sp. Cla-17 TaxID=2803751 RepID=UPI001492A68F|nr:hypothetical protein [Leptolyngbya sp. Cla-17]MBM0741134.1 hypothetical protein [Leptolyngbya sp. Cla-17]